MQAARPVPRHAAVPDVRGLTPRPTRVGWGLFWVTFGVYTALGVWLNAGIEFIFVDSLSRVAAVSGMLLSRDPHLAAIGFVFTPLTAAAQLPLGALGHWWPWLLRWNITAAVMSAGFMAGAVVQIRGMARDRGCGTAFTVLLVALFAANPMIILYAANGMSEAPFLFSLCWAVRRMIRWVRTDDVHDLLLTGIALALAYLTRYDALAPMLVCATMVAGVSVTRQRTSAVRNPGGSNRWWAALMDAVVVALPGLLAFALWTASSWLITGTAFQQFSSVYGNSAIIAQSGTVAGAKADQAAFALAEVLVLSPAFPIILVVALVVSYRRRDLEVIAPVLLFGSVVGTQALLYVQGSTFPFLRFYIAIIPLTCCLVVMTHRPSGTVVARRMGPASVPRPPHLDRRYIGPSLYVVTATVLVIGSTAVTTVGMGDARLGALEHSLASAIVPGRHAPSEEAILRTFSVERQLADYLDSLHLRDGAVLLDTVESFAVVTSSANPKQFVITSDTDFVPTLNDLAGHGVQYVLSVPNERRGTADAVNRRYPTMYENGSGGVATLVLEIPNTPNIDPVRWRLYRVVGSPR